MLLKYKGNGLVEPRSGDSVGRVGLLGLLQGHRHAANIVDYSTNVPAVHKKYVLSASVLAVDSEKR